MKHRCYLVLAGLFAACTAHSNDHQATDNADGAVDADGATAPACTPSATAPPPGSPVIFSAPSPVAPGDTALLFGAAVGSDAQVVGVQLVDADPGLPPRIADCVPPGATALTVLEPSDLSAKAILPNAWTAGMYALAISNAAGTGAPVILNRPRIDWIHSAPGGVVASGGTLDIYGRSFGSAPAAWIADASGHATALVAVTGPPSDGYVASYTVPTLPAGAYQLYVHNGHGGRYGFSDPFAVTVAVPTPWPTTVFTVAAKTGNDDQAFATALAGATANHGGIIEFATGTYTLTKGVKIPPYTVVRSASSNRADVTITMTEPTTPFPYAFAGDSNFSVESITVTSSSSARLFQCPSGANFLRDPTTGEPQNQPDAPCENARLHDVSFTLTTQRNLVSGATTTPTFTLMVVVKGNDVEISDNTLINTGGGATLISGTNGLDMHHNTLTSGSARTAVDAPVPVIAGSPGGGCGFYSIRNAAIVDNTVGPGSDLGNAATMYVEYQAQNMYVADNTIGPNTSDYGEGFSFDAPYYPNFLDTVLAPTGRAFKIPRVLNAAGNSAFGGPTTGLFNADDLDGQSVVVVNGTGLGQFAQVATNAASAGDGSTLVTIDRDWAVPLDATSVVEIAVNKSKVVFTRNAFHDVAVGAQLYAGAYDFLIDGNTGETMEGTYCSANQFMHPRATAGDLEMRFSRCYFNQWINNTMTNQVDATYPWKHPTGPGVFTPYTNGLVGLTLGIGTDPLLPAVRGILAAGNIARHNQVQDFTFGAVAKPLGTLPAGLTYGRDNVFELNSTQAVPIGVFVDKQLPDSLVQGNTCATGCTTVEQNLSSM